MDEHKKFLADRILSEERPITYRILSRALDVHVNTAKEMLYDFHKYQNALRADSVHATYLICGAKAADTQSDGDVEMNSSPPEHDSLSDPVSTTTIMVVKEENLKETLAQYQIVHSIHIYSLAPHPQKDLSLLAGVAKAISEYSTNDDDATLSKKFGTIYNPLVRRRDRKARAPASVAAPAKPAKQEPAPAKAALVKDEPAPPATIKKETSSTSAKDQAPSSSSAKRIPAPAKKGAAGGGLAAAFAKAKPPKPKPAVKKEEEDTAMAMSDDGEAGDDDMPMPKKEVAADSEIRRTKKQREDVLRRMMDEEEDEADEEEEKDLDDEEMEEPEPEPEPVEEPEPAVKEEKKEPDEVVSSAGDGRRRGKRRVMRKKRMLDEQGYMVTIQEAGWESFSEDESGPAAKKETPTSTPASSAAKPKKAAPAKGSQGSIMSFFGKK